MISALRQTLTTLKKINASALVSDKISPEVFHKHEQEIQTLEKSIKNYLTLLHSFDDKQDGVEKAGELLVDMHIKLMNFVSSIDSLDELLIEIIKKTPEPQ